MKLGLVFLLSGLLLVSGCYVDKTEKGADSAAGADNFQLIEAHDGQVYRLHKPSGDLFLVKGGVMMPVEQVNEEIYDGEAVAELEKPRFLGEKQMPGEKLNLALKTAWQEGDLCFSMKVYPYESVKKLYDEKVAHYARMVIHLKDKDGFTVLEIPVALTDMTEIKNESGGVDHLSLSSRGPFSAQMYQDIDDFYVVWKLNSELIPDAETTE